MIRIYINEALKNIRINFILNAAIVIMIVSVMTFMGIICVQVKISDQKTEVSLGQEAFIEFSQYHFITPGRRTLRLLERLDDNYERTVPEEEAFIYYVLSDNPDVNAKYLRNCDKVWDFYRKLKSIPGVFIESYKIFSMDQDSYEGYTVPAHTGEFLVEMDFFKLESLTYLKGREPEEDDFYVDEDGIRIVPVVIGYQLKDIFDIGDLIYVKKYIDSYPKASLKQKICYSQLYTKGKVVGILDRSNSFMHPSGDTFLWNASLSIIWPDNKSPSPDNYPELRNDEKAYIDVTWNVACDMPTMKIYINKTNEEQAVAEIRQALKDTGLDIMFDIERNNASYARISAAIEKGRTDSYLTVAACVGILCLFGMGVLVIMLNVSNTRDYSIHRLTGASKRDLAVMTTVQVIILLLVSDILIHYPYILSPTGLFLNGDSMRYIFATGADFYRMVAVINIVIIILTYVISRIYTARIDIVTTIKDKE